MMVYDVVTVNGFLGLRCFLCGIVSYSPRDVAYRYCGRCHLFLDVVDEMRRLHAAGYHHNCGEWPTWRGVCAICGLEFPCRSGKRRRPDGP